MILMNPFEDTSDNTFNPESSDVLLNPFEDISDKTVILKNENITIWVESRGRKKNTYIKGWNISEEIMKDHLKTIKKKNGCNGSVKSLPNDDSEEDSDVKIDESLSIVMQLQGDHADYIIDYLIKTGIDKKTIHVKG